MIRSKASTVGLFLLVAAEDLTSFSKAIATNTADIATANEGDADTDTLGLAIGTQSWPTARKDENDAGAQGVVQERSSSSSSTSVAVIHHHRGLNPVVNYEETVIDEETFQSWSTGDEAQAVGYWYINDGKESKIEDKFDTNLVKLKKDAGDDASLFSIPINLDPFDALRIDFEHTAKRFKDGIQDGFYLEIDWDGGTTYTDSQTHFYQGRDFDNDVNDESFFYAQSVSYDSLPSVRGATKVRFRCAASNKGEVRIDNVRLTGLTEETDDDPSAAPSREPSSGPSWKPSNLPTHKPSGSPSKTPTAPPTQVPSVRPTDSQKPSEVPSMEPSLSQVPSAQPSPSPSTLHPTLSSSPSSNPSAQPSPSPSVWPSGGPTMKPSDHPSLDPSADPSVEPSLEPTKTPSSGPTLFPTDMPSTLPSTSIAPSGSPSLEPSSAPTSPPTTAPSLFPSISLAPSEKPSNRPSSAPSQVPSIVPSEGETLAPTPAPVIVYNELDHEFFDDWPDPREIPGDTLWQNFGGQAKVDDKYLDAISPGNADTFAAKLKKDDGLDSSFWTDPIDVSNIVYLRIEFNYTNKKFLTGEGFYFESFETDSSGILETPLLDKRFTVGVDFEASGSGGVWHYGFVELTDLSLIDYIILRFRCEASDKGEVHIDHIILTAIEGTKSPTSSPSAEPSTTPTAKPTAAPSNPPTREASSSPSLSQTPSTSQEPTSEPSLSLHPSEKPTDFPSGEPSAIPSTEPTESGPPLRDTANSAGNEDHDISECEGHCATSNDCEWGLNCYDGPESRVPGCSGERASGINYCYDPPDGEFVLAGNGSDGVAPRDNPGILQLCEGDCDGDEDCADGLKCWDRSNDEPASDQTPFSDPCSGKLLDTEDYCILDVGNLPTTEPSASPTLSTNPTVRTFPSESQEPSQTPSQDPSMGPSQSSSPTDPGEVCDNPTYHPGDLTVVLSCTDCDGNLLASTGLMGRLLTRRGDKVELTVNGLTTLSDDDMHKDSDGATTLPDDSNPDYYFLVSNQETASTGGGVGILHFDSSTTPHNVIGYRQTGQKPCDNDDCNNCGGGRTPWDTWLSAEEASKGQVYDVDPNEPPGDDYCKTNIVPTEGGRYEAVAYWDEDPDDTNAKYHFFTTEDSSSNYRLTRFIPDKTKAEMNAIPRKLDRLCGANGTGSHSFLKMTCVNDCNSDTPSGTYSWDASSRSNANGDQEYPNCEGIDRKGDFLYFVSKDQDRLYILDLAGNSWESVSTIEDGGTFSPDQIARINGKDSPNDLLYFAEDSSSSNDIHARGLTGNIVNGEPEYGFFTIIQGFDESETTGLTFSPDNKMIYFAHQDNSEIWQIWRQDGCTFGNGNYLDVHYHQDSVGRRFLRYSHHQWGSRSASRKSKKVDR